MWRGKAPPQKFLFYYVAFALGTVHAQMIGASFAHPGLRLVSWVMLAILFGVFVWKRTRKQRPTTRVKM